jgi:hypothetical protein
MEELRPAQDVVVVVLEVVVLWQTHQVAVLDLQQVLSLSSTYTSLTDTHHLHTLMAKQSEDKTTLYGWVRSLQARREGVLQVVGKFVFLVGIWGGRIRGANAP